MDRGRTLARPAKPDKPALMSFEEQHCRMCICEIEDAAGCRQRSDRLGGGRCPGASRSYPGREHDVEFAVNDLRCVVNVGANKVGRDADLRRQPPRLGNRRRREIEAGRDRALPREDQDIEPEMALQMDQPLTSNFAELATSIEYSRFSLARNCSTP